MGISFTEDQQQVIDAKDANILVSAAAGSGKTAVLTERIVKKISEDNPPVDIDRLLVLTFTKAAAAQMRRRIGAALEERLRQQPENAHLQKQTTLLHNAQITTFDSFCQFLLRNHFQEVGLDPAFRVADEQETALLRQDALAVVLEQAYDSGDEAFLACMEFFSTGSWDKDAEDIILSLETFAESEPFPEEWLEERRKDYDWPEDGRAAWLSAYLETSVAPALQEIIRRYENCISDCEKLYAQPLDAGKAAETKSLDILKQEQKQAEEILSQVSARDTSYAALYEVFSGIGFERFNKPSVKTYAYDEAEWERVKEVRNAAKGKLQTLQKKNFAMPPAELAAEMKACGAAVSALVDITLAFRAEFIRMKRDKNLVDFGDLEHLALALLLQRKEDGNLVPTDVAMTLKKRYAEILIDEYQDCNAVQEYLMQTLSDESSGRFDRFMVGDIKQSIYGFRQAKPEIFLHKYETYAAKEAGQAAHKLRIDLRQNFRSRPQVLQTVNGVFGQVMQPELGGIAYDEAAALYPGAVYAEPACAESVRPYDSELLLFQVKGGTAGQTADAFLNPDASAADDDEEDDQDETGAEGLSAKKQEAYGIAEKIRELVGKLLVTDEKTGVLRPASYRDIAILLRSGQNFSDILQEVLESRGIPVHVESKAGYFSVSEIQDLLHYLQCLDNPRQDIPLYGALRACFGGFSEEELACMKVACPDESCLYDTLCAYAPQNKKARTFLDRLSADRDLAAHLSVRRLLETILREFDYMAHILVKPGGDRRRANVEQLLVRAADYEKTSYYGLYQFLRYVDQIQKFDMDYGEANLLDENADVVRIMTMHKSKGLEFPIVILAGLDKKYNKKDSGGCLVRHAAKGIGVRYVDPAQRIERKNLRYWYVADQISADMRAEELRVLYVAMTRAKEKLIMTASVKETLNASLEKKAEALLPIQEEKNPIVPVARLQEQDSFLDVILLATCRNRCFDEVWQAFGKPVNTHTPIYEDDFALRVQLCQVEDIITKQLEEDTDRLARQEKLRLAGEPAGLSFADTEFMTRVSEKFAWQYPYANLADLYTKTTVSEMKKKAMEEETEGAASLFEEKPIVPYVPKFLRGSEQEEVYGGPKRGTAFHRVLELFDFASLVGADRPNQAAVRKLLDEAIDAMVASGKFDEESRALLSMKQLVCFLQSDIAGRMAQAAGAGKLRKEQPFVLGISAARVDSAFPAEETVLIQGIIDAFFEEDDGLVLLDYKTDKVEPGQAGRDELCNRYHTQLDYYEEALVQILSPLPDEKQGQTAPVSVKEKVIYSFCLGESITL